MFLCDILNDIGGSMDDMGLFDVPVLGNFWLAIILSLLELFGCGN